MQKLLYVCVYFPSYCWLYMWRQLWERSVWSVVVRHHTAATGFFIPTLADKDLSAWEDCRGISQEIHRTGSSGHSFTVWKWFRRRRGKSSNIRSVVERYVQLSRNDCEPKFNVQLIAEIIGIRDCCCHQSASIKAHCPYLTSPVVAEEKTAPVIVLDFWVSYCAPTLLGERNGFWPGCCYL